ncbi:MAG: TIM-barrel domain-containing protein [Phycisphaerales bacterium]
MPRVATHYAHGTLAFLAFCLFTRVLPVEAQVVHERIGEGVVRSFASPASQQNAEPSVALVSDPPALGLPPVGFGPLPVFSVVDGLQTVTVSVEPGTNLYATGSQSGPMERSGRRVEYYNLDNFAWNDSSNRNYQTHPWVLGLRADGTAFGVLFDSTWSSSLDLERPTSDGIVFQTTGPSPRVVTIDADSPQTVVMRLADLTGMPFMPPMWSVGYHQSKYSYTPQGYALQIAQEFRNRQIPAEVIWLDIDYMDGFRNFTFNPQTFPDPSQLNSQLDSIGFQAVWMANCGIKVDGGYDAYQQISAQGLAVQRADRSEYRADVWPGLSVWPDFTMQSTRDWWAGRIASFASIGVDGIWNDMNEPAVFNVQSKTMPDDNHHRADADLGGPGPHLKYHNIYGMQMSRATRQGMLQAFPDRRPFVLTRAGYIGGQRYAAMWTGDNIANWYHVDVSLQNVINIGLSGQPNNGPDIGGFNGDSGAAMYARWMGLGAMMPFARGHYGFASRDREPWSYGAQTEATIRRALNRRYRLLNYFYTQFYTAHTTGLPVCRPLFFVEPDNPDLRFWDDGFLVGPGLLVVGATTPGAVPQPPPMRTPIYRLGFPESDAPGALADTLDPDLPNLYVLGGHIVVANNLVQHSRELTPQRDEPIELIIALDESGSALGQFYEDAGDGFEYAQGEYALAQFVATRIGDTVEVDLVGVQGTLAFLDRPIVARVLLGGGDEIQFGGTTGSLPFRFQTPTPTPDQQPDPAILDGRLLGEAFGSASRLATNESDRFAEISQLRALYAAGRSGGIAVGIEGELAIDGTAVALLIDAGPGGQSMLSTSSLPPPPGGLSDLTGTRLEQGFEPERMLFANAFDGSVFCDWVTLEQNGNASKVYLGRQFVGSGSGALSEGTDSLGIEIALGSAGHAAGSGFEMFFPTSVVGPGEGRFGRVRVLAMVVKPWGAITNQTLPSSGNTWPGNAPDFRTIPGVQFAEFLLRPDVNADGAIDYSDVIEFLRLVDAGDPDADLAAPFGQVDATDAAAYIRMAFAP